MEKSKKLSNSFSTGGGGVHFEAHIQASFVVLMLTGGHAPCLPCWPIAEIKLQGKIDGFDTDDLIVVVEDVNSKERRKLLGQVKHSITITKGGALFGEVMQSAWNDFKNPNMFTRDKDIIALITGHLSSTDARNVQWLLNQARHTKSVDEFFRNVKQANYSPPKSFEKLEVIWHHLRASNSGNDVSRSELYDFLNHFHLLGYDLGNEFGVVLSLLNSHISQFQPKYPQFAWSRVVDIVQTWNQDAGTITPSKLPEDLLDTFKQKAAMEVMPEEFKAAKKKLKTDWAQHPDATYLALAVLIGSWQDKSRCDLEAITQLLGIEYDEWLKKAREILHSTDSPLSHKNGTWKVVNRAELWSLLAYRIFDQNLDTFRALAVSVLNEEDPAFELPTEDRYAASVYGKVMNYSHVLRKGIAEGLAILANQPEACSNCSHGKTETTCVSVIHELLTDADWVLWGSLNELLPTMAEAAPSEFLHSVEKAMDMTSCPFDELFSQQGSGITSRNYLTGLLWALEGLAWEEQYMVRVGVALAELASHDPGGQSSNGAFNSITTILLPWCPQTLASTDKRNVAVRTILQERPDIAWNLIIQLLPGKRQTSFRSHKPRWRKIIPDDWGKDVTEQEYWNQVSFYAELAVTEASQNPARLPELIDHFDNLTAPAFDQLLQVLVSKSVSELPEEQRLSIWNHLTEFTNKHRRFSDAKWALPDELIIRIEQVAEQLAPTELFNLYQRLFTDRDFDLYDENEDWKELEMRRERAITEIFQQYAAEGVIRFAESVSFPYLAGSALGVISDLVIERTLLPYFLDSENNRRKELVRGFIRRRYRIKGWGWCEDINRSDWSQEQVGQFLACLPFSKEAWERASVWLQKEEREYWTRTDANANQADGDLSIAVDKLINFSRPNAAINCLNRMRHDKQPIDSNQCVRALLGALSSSEIDYTMKEYRVVELIKFLQSEPSVNEGDLFRVEWAYLSLLYSPRNGGAPKLLESKLAHDPEFFFEVIRLIYRSKKEDHSPRVSDEDAEVIAKNAWRLLDRWKIPPGTQENGVFSEERFDEWIKRVKEICTESGHLEVALAYVGKVLIHATPDPDGLWINRHVATILNDREADNMREEFITALYRSRGTKFVDPTGKPERDLAKKFRGKAEEIESAGFHRLAIALRDLAKGYDREAELVINKIL